MTAHLRGIGYHLPVGRRTNEDLVRLNPKWDGDSIYAKTGIRSRPIATAGETAADLGYSAAENVIEQCRFDRANIDTLLLCTQSPDYALPTTACLLQERLKLPPDCGALDVNLGCSGFTYGIWLATALIESRSAESILLVVADTYSKYCSIHDLATSTIFSDGGAAAIITASSEGALARFGRTVVGTDGRGGEHLIVRAGGARCPRSERTAEVRRDRSGNERSDEHLFMNGPAVYSFALSRVPEAIDKLLNDAGLTLDVIDLFLFHQANRFMLRELGAKMGIQAERMPIDVEHLGNSAGASLPTLLCRCMERGVLRPGDRCVLAGFGVGFSWAVTYMEWMAETQRRGGTRPEG